MTETTDQPTKGLEVPELVETAPGAAPTPHDTVPDLAVAPRKELKALLEALLNACEDTNENGSSVSNDLRILDAANDFMAAYMATGLDRDLGVNISGTMAEVLAVQTTSGNYDYNPYMHGLANGLILAQSLFLNTTPEFMEAPEVWIEDFRDADGESDDPVAHETVLAEQINLSKEGNTTTTADTQLPE